MNLETIKKVLKAHQIKYTYNKKDIFLNGLKITNINKKELKILLGY